MAGLRAWFGRRRAEAPRQPGSAPPDEAVSGVADALRAGVELGEFVIDRVLGPGGFGLTYLARDVSLDAWRAVKEYLPRDCGARRRDGTVGPRSSADAEAYRWGLERFLEEARTLARFDHRDIVRVYRAFEARGTAYLVMEYVEGRSLAAALRDAGGALPDDRVRAMLLAVTDGLATVHEAGLLHRDIKPDNIMLRPDDTPVLIDFGAARQLTGQRSQSVAALVSPGYAPVEQYSTRNPQGPWTDVYALGAVAYVALSGQVPEEATERADADRLMRVADAACRPVDAALAAAVDAALAVNAADRPQSVGEWRAMLEVPGVPPRAEPQTPWMDGAMPGGGRWGPGGGGVRVVGRGEGCDVWLADTSVSRRHAEVVRLSDGRLQVSDLGSTNGTFVLDAGVWRAFDCEVLAPTDCVRFGDHEATAGELAALCSGAAPLRAFGVDEGESEDGASGGTGETPDPRMELVRDAETGEIRQREPMARHRRRP